MCRIVDLLQFETFLDSVMASSVVFESREWVVETFGGVDRGIPR
jgi:hypothetical protein